MLDLLLDRLFDLLFDLLLDLLFWLSLNSASRAFSCFRRVCCCFLSCRALAEPPLPLEFLPSLRGDSQLFSLIFFLVHYFYNTPLQLWCQVFVNGGRSLFGIALYLSPQQPARDPG
ncbi:hypothetical protein HC766_09495 [Candidatus Gracilibacteria bacterium]|nr:hypothetical protein [Candidatus Gracilibacteria bacterium]